MADHPRTEGRTRRGRWWWLAALILVPVVLGSTLSVVLLLTLVDATTSADQIELIKTGLAVGAGMGGAVALVLAGRRQWSTEQAHRVTEQSAADARHDATERRITDLYSKAADQLGSDKAAVRLAGLYSLERLAQNTPDLRQTIVNVLCAYLRMPFRVPQPSDEEEGPHSDRQELEVRQAAQRILAAHLAPQSPFDPVAGFWSGITLDLRGAVLYSFDPKGARMAEGLFGGASFVGWTRFDECVFDGGAHFGGVEFTGPASFRSASFRAKAVFRGATFSGSARFDRSEFEDAALFGGMRPLDSGDVQDGATFRQGATFTGTTFAKPPVFDYVRADKPLVGLSNPDGSGELD